MTGIIELRPGVRIWFGGTSWEVVTLHGCEVFRYALELGGTLTGEHGVGTLKRRWLSLELGEDSMQLHRSIKASFDPLGILNPGKGF